jgi:hypothetical protein
MIPGAFMTYQDNPAKKTGPMARMRVVTEPRAVDQVIVE